MPDDSLMSKRLVLKTSKITYGNKILDFYTRNQEFLRKWETVRDQEFYTLAYQEQQLHDELETMKEGRLYKVWIFNREDRGLGDVIGSIALNNIVRGAFQSCHLGYKMDQNFFNKGYMTEALGKVIDYAFNVLKLHRIEANIMPHNAASLRVVEKLGFYHEGLAKKYLKINNRWEDHIHMVLLNKLME